MEVYKLISKIFNFNFKYILSVQYRFCLLCLIGKTVDELTEFCKKLSKGEANGYLSNISGDSDIDADLEKPFHHPFVIKDRGPIVMNIKVNYCKIQIEKSF